MSHVKARIAQLSPEQRAHLERHLQLRAARMSAAAVLEVPPERRADVPASSAQRRLWLAQRMDRTGSAYHIHGAIRFKGALQLEALVCALAEIVRRHESLRTVFDERDGDVVQRVVTVDVLRQIVQRDFSGLEGAARDEAVDAALREQSRTPFDLSAGPLFRFALLKEAAASHVLGVTLHHIVADAWSMTVFLNELSELYAAYRAGRLSPLPDLPLQYADVARRERADAGSTAKALEYWKTRLASPPAPLELAPGRRAQSAGTRPGSSRKRQLPRDVS